MRRKIFGILGLLALLGALSGCDTCGNLAKFNLPSIPKTCHGDPPAH